jgi:hypothetical protein
MKEDVRMNRLLEGRAERGHQAVREGTDEAHRVGDGDPPDLGQVEPSSRRIERREQLVAAYAPACVSALKSVDLPAFV